MKYLKCCGNCISFKGDVISPASQGQCKNSELSGKFWIHAIDDYDCGEFSYKKNPTIKASLEVNIKLVSKPKVTDERPHIQEQELEIGRRIANMVYDMNPACFKEVWISFFSGVIYWNAIKPAPYYVDHSYYYVKGV